MKGIISEDDFSMLREEYTKDVESYQTRFENIEKQLDEIEERKDNSKDIDSILKKYKNIKKLTRIIVEEFIEKIYVSALDKNTNTREIEIEWNLDL
jgi:phosphopantetheine adenylyltransferase